MVTFNILFYHQESIYSICS